MIGEAIHVSADDLKAMHERGDYVSTRPDSPTVEIDDEFWQNARVVHAAETVGR